jgi:hypothetical protein
MDRRAQESPMDFSWANGCGPVDESSPFVKFTQQNRPGNGKRKFSWCQLIAPFSNMCQALTVSSIRLRNRSPNFPASAQPSAKPRSSLTYHQFRHLPAQAAAQASLQIKPSSIPHANSILSPHLGEKRPTTLQETTAIVRPRPTIT